MGDGRTPTIVVTGAGSEGTVTFTDARSIWPFAQVTGTRRVTERETRESSTGANKTISVFKRWNGSEEEFSFSATLVKADMAKLKAIHRADPPACSVAFTSGASYSETWSEATLRTFSAVEDPLSDNDGNGPLEWVVTGTIHRESD